MSEKIETRTMHNAWGIHITRSSGRVTLEVNGESENGRQLKFKISFPFFRWPCAALQMKKAWTDERADRVMELNRIDKSMPAEEVV